MRSPLGANGVCGLANGSRAPSDGDDRRAIFGAEADGDMPWATTNLPSWQNFP